MIIYHLYFIYNLNIIYTLINVKYFLSTFISTLLASSLLSESNTQIGIIMHYGNMVFQNSYSKHCGNYINSKHVLFNLRYCSAMEYKRHYLYCYKS